MILLLGGASGGGVGRICESSSPPPAFPPSRCPAPQGSLGTTSVLTICGQCHARVLPHARLYSSIFPSHFLSSLFESIFPQDLLVLLVLGMLPALQAPPLPLHLHLGSSMGLRGSWSCSRVSQHMLEVATIFCHSHPQVSDVEGNARLLGLVLQHWLLHGPPAACRWSEGWGRLTGNSGSQPRWQLSSPAGGSSWCRCGTRKLFALYVL